MEHWPDMDQSKTEFDIYLKKNFQFKLLVRHISHLITSQLLLRRRFPYL